MFDLLHGQLASQIREHGVLALGVLTTLESMGIPVPGESAVIAGALYAATSHEIGILPLVAAAAGGAILGDNIGYLLGRQVGFHLIARFGRHVGLTPTRVKVSRYLFQRYGGNVVFFGRFIAFLRTFTALLAGANCMEWKRFLLFNALGGIAWASLYGFGAYLLGHEVERLAAPLEIGLGGVALIVIAAAIYLTRKYGNQLQREAESAFPGQENPTAPSP